MKSPTLTFRAVTIPVKGAMTLLKFVIASYCWTVCRAAATWALSEAAFASIWSFCCCVTAMVVRAS